VTQVVVPPFSVRVHSQSTVTVERKVILELPRGHGLQLLPGPVARKGRFDFRKDAKAIQSVFFKLLQGDFIPWRLVVT